MAMSQAKQYLRLRGQTLLEWSLRPFLESGWIDGVVVVLAPDDPQYQDLSMLGHPKIVLAEGAQTRAGSVMAGLRRIQHYATGAAPVFVLVHDAARPGLRRGDLRNLRAQASTEQGGLLALPVVDTLKRADRERTLETVDRGALWRAQTPQMFRLDLLSKALAAATDAAWEPTDDASAMERAGFRPRLIRGHERLMKVTYAADLALAEFWLGQTEDN